MRVKLGEVFDLQMGKTPARNNPDYWNGDNAWVSISDLGNTEKYIDRTKEKITDKGVKESGIKIVPKGTVIMSFKLSIGKTAITAGDMYTNEAIMAFLDKKICEMDTDYLYHLFSGFDWSAGTNKAVMGLTLNKATLSKKEIPLPPITEQRKIAAVLDKVCELIALRRKQLERLDLMVKARFAEMFGESRLNSKGWGTVKLENIAYVGSSKRVFVEELKNEGVPFYRGTEIGALALGETVYPELFIAEEHYKRLCKATGKPLVGDLLMPSICSDGRIWLVDNDNPFYFKDGRVLWVHPTSEQIDSCYLQYALKEKIVSDYSSIASGTTFAELKIFALKALSIMMAPLEQQQQFSAFVAEIDKLKLPIQRSLDTLEVLKKSLMQEYFGQGE